MPADAPLDALALAEIALAQRARASEYEIDELHEESIRPGEAHAPRPVHEYEKSPDGATSADELNEASAVPVTADEAGRGHERLNRGALMTLGHVRGYPRLPLSPGIAIAEGCAAWRAFTFYGGERHHLLAVQAARATWSDDPMTEYLTYVDSEPVEVSVAASSLDADDVGAHCDPAEPCCEHSGVWFDQQHSHVDAAEMIDAYRAGQEDQYVEHGPSVGGAA